MLTEGRIAVLSTLGGGWIFPTVTAVYNKLFFGPTCISSISICSAVFAGFINVTNRQTDRQTHGPTTLARI